MKRKPTLHSEILKYLREENESLTRENDRLVREAFEKEITNRTASWLHQAVRVLARALPDTVVGIRAKRLAREAFDAAGFPPPRELKKIRKKSPRQKKRPRVIKPR